MTRLLPGGEKVPLSGRPSAGDPVVYGRLYDDHAERLYTYCRAMVGEEEAAAALRDAFTAATRAPGPGEDEARIWLYGFVRAECLRRDPRPRPATSPLDRAAARLRREHREALVLAASLEIADVARVLGVAIDTAAMLLEMARRRLAQAAIAVLGAEATGRLHERVTRTYAPPPELRDQVLVACSAAGRAAAGALLFDDSGMPVAPETLFRGAEAVTRPLPRVEPVRAPHRSKRGSSGPVLCVAVGAAIAVGVLALWPATGGGGASNVDRTSRLGGSSPPRSSSLGGSRRSVWRRSAPPASGTPSPARLPTPGRRSTPSPSPSASRPVPPGRASAPPHPPHGHGHSHGPKNP